jgi:hypothetical protein
MLQQKKFKIFILIITIGIGIVFMGWFIGTEHSLKLLMIFEVDLPVLNRLKYSL